MIAAPSRNEEEGLLQGLLQEGNVEINVASGTRFFSAHLSGRDVDTVSYSCHEDVWSAQTEHWTLHAWLGETRKIQFVRRNNPHAPDRETLSVHLVGPDGSSLIRVD